jgi:hypothetical protein
METKIATVTSVKSSNHRVTRIRIGGLWLNSIGFEYDKLISVTFSKGCITIKLEGESNLDLYLKIAKEMLQNNSGTVLQVSRDCKNRNYEPQIILRGSILTDNGFTIGSTFSIQYEHGFMKLTVLDMDKIRKY